MFVVRFETMAVVKSKLASEILFHLCRLNFESFSKVAGFCPSPNTKESCLCLQDPIPPELVHVLRNSKDPLLQKLFPVTERNQNNIKTQNRAAVVTVVSKFKVHPIQASDFCLRNWMRKQYGWTKSSKCY